MNSRPNNMKTNHFEWSDYLPNRRQVFWIFLITVILLLIPLCAMQFSEAVNWQPGDFIIMAGLLLTSGFGICVIVNHKPRRKILSSAAILVIVLVFFFIWAQLAVGVI